MFNWLRTILRKSSKEKEESGPPPTHLNCNLDGIIKPRYVLCVVGMMIQVQTESGTTLIREFQAVDRAEFWHIWKVHNPNDIRDPDGNRFQPPV